MKKIYIVILIILSLMFSGCDVLLVEDNDVTEYLDSNYYQNFNNQLSVGDSDCTSWTKGEALNACEDNYDIFIGESFDNPSYDIENEKGHYLITKTNNDFSKVVRYYVQFEVIDEQLYVSELTYEKNEIYLGNIVNEKVNDLQLQGDLEGLIMENYNVDIDGSVDTCDDFTYNKSTETCESGLPEFTGPFIKDPYISYSKIGPSRYEIIKESQDGLYQVIYDLTFVEIDGVFYVSNSSYVVIEKYNELEYAKSILESFIDEVIVSGVDKACDLYSKDTVTCSIATMGGVQADTIEEAEVREPGELGHSARVVGNSGETLVEFEFNVIRDVDNGIYYIDFIEEIRNYITDSVMLEAYYKLFIDEFNDVTITNDELMNKFKGNLTDSLLLSIRSDILQYSSLTFMSIENHASDDGEYAFSSIGLYYCQKDICYLHTLNLQLEDDPDSESNETEPFSVTIIIAEERFTYLEPDE